MPFEQIAQRSETLAGAKTCPFCQTFLQFHDSEMSRWRDPNGTTIAYINNVTLKCAQCKYLARFGIQVSKEWFEEEEHIRGGVRTVSIFDRYFITENEIQRKRLEALGYL